MEKQKMRNKKKDFNDDVWFSCLQNTHYYIMRNYLLIMLTNERH